MSEVKHTPLPWEADEDHIYGGGDRFIAAMWDGGDDERAKANARLIVQAVNSHGDLVEALRLVSEYLAGTGEGAGIKRIVDTALSKVLELGEGL